MVHLASIPNDSEAKASIVNGLEQIKFEEPSEDEVTESVYGSRFANFELPNHCLPEREMPKEVAYRMIKDHLSLDGNPTLNLARQFNRSSDPMLETDLELASSLRTWRRR